MAIVERIPVKPIAEVLISLTKEEAKLLKKILGRFSGPYGDHVAYFSNHLYVKLEQAGINHIF